VVLHAEGVAPYTTRPVKMELLSYQEAKALLGGGDALQGCLAGVIAGSRATRKCKLGKRSEESQLPERGHNDEPALPVSASGSTVAAEEGAEAQSLDFISVTLTRGRFHEIRLLLRAIGFETMRLIRLTCGPLSDPRLLASPGAWREIEGEELERLVEYSHAHRCEHKASDEAEVFADRLM
jgi:16S rRNA U516 pseudouridylate synthase RsuA-like enzyme